MTTAITEHSEASTAPAHQASLTQQFVTLRVDKQLFGIPVMDVQDVMRPKTITPVPLAEPYIAGALNIRGRIVVAIDIRSYLGIAPREKGEKFMLVTVEHGDEWYSLLVDEVGEVMALEQRLFDANPPNLGSQWKKLSDGVYRLDGELMIVLNIQNMVET